MFGHRYSFDGGSGRSASNIWVASVLPKRNGAFTVSSHHRVGASEPRPRRNMKKLDPIRPRTQIHPAIFRRSVLRHVHPGWATAGYPQRVPPHHPRRSAHGSRWSPEATAGRPYTPGRVAHHSDGPFGGAAPKK